MLNKALSLILVIVLIFPCLSVNSSAEMYLSAKSACLMIAETGEVIFEKNAHERRGMASTTKIMTSLVALENCDLFRKTKAKKENVMIEGTSIGLKPNDEIDLLTLVKGMLLESGNDAANVTATLVAGGKSEFALLMNKKAKELGMYNSSFVNPSGLTEENHYSTAYDMALLGSCALENETFRRIASCSSFRVSYGTPKYERTFYNHNRFINMYDGAIGIKTGFTKASGRCLVTAAERNGVTLVAVTLSAPDDWNDHKKLLDYGFSVVKTRAVDVDLSKNKIPVVNGKISTLSLAVEGEIIVPYYKSVPKYNLSVCTPKFLYGGIQTGDYIGWVELVAQNGKIIDKAYIVSAQNVENIIKTDINKVEKEPTLLEKIFN